MTFPASIANLTKAVNEITAETNVPKSTLDAKVAQAEAETPLAQAQQALAEGYRDEAATHAADAATHLATVQAGVTYQGIEAILAEKAVTAVDVFVYDTSLDSDGGAWRKRCQHTSWYNEELNTATRGSRREFPAVAVIVAATGSITIYDGDDPALPMWKVIPRVSATVYEGFWYSSQNLNALTAGQGRIIIAVGASSNASGMRVLDFAGDEIERYTAQLNYGNTYYTGTLGNIVDGINGVCQPSGLNPIVNFTVNDVAMTVLPDAPVDPATGLPVPTIAVATAGGVSVIKDDGNVWDITFSGGWGNNITQIQAANENVYFQDSIYYWLKIPIKDVDQDRVVGNYPFDATTPFVQMQPNGTTFSSASGAALENSDIELAYTQGNTRAGIVAMTQDAAMRFDVTSKFNTGWMNGAIKGAFLSDTDDTDLVAQTSLIPNGDFSAADTFWVNNANSTSQIVSGQLEITATADFGGVTPNSSFQTAGWYWVEADLISGTGRFTFEFPGSGGDFPNINRTGPYSYRGYVQLRSDGYFKPNLRTSVSGTTTVWDNLRMVKVDDDRSVSNKGLIVNGTVTRSPVATSAELVAYSGFSASNYLEQPYNSALDFGTGNFSIMGWVKQIAGSAGYVMERRFPDGTGNYIRLYLDGNTIPVFGTNGRTLVGSKPCGLNQWAHVCCVRDGVDMAIYVNGVLDVTVVGQYDVSSVGAVARFGRAVNVSALQFYGELALWRISATAPTDDQIAKIYEDERKLFQPGAQCTLYGTSDAVTALAHDPKTNLLHVGTSAGRSTFDGLVRVANTTTPVGTAISAVNGLIVEE